MWNSQLWLDDIDEDKDAAAVFDDIIDDVKVMVESTASGDWFGDAGAPELKLMIMEVRFFAAYIILDKHINPDFLGGGVGLKCTLFDLRGFLIRQH